MNELIPLRPYWNIVFNHKSNRIIVKIRPSDFYGEDVIFDFAIEQIADFVTNHVPLIYIVYKMGDDFVKVYYNPQEKYYIEFDVLKELTNDIKQEITKVYPDFFNEE